jgi:HEPN domain-containing protein
MRGEAERWLRRALEDLDAASSLEASRHPDVMAFLAQQAVEKALKAVWVELGLLPPRTHDLGYLWGAVKDGVMVDLNPDHLDFLTRFGVDACYPDLVVRPEEAREALSLAQALVAELRRWLHGR